MIFFADVKKSIKINESKTIEQFNFNHIHRIDGISFTMNINIYSDCLCTV